MSQPDSFQPVGSVAVSGKPGGGKSYFATAVILGELENGKRSIVTNLPLRLDNIVAYFLKRDRPDVAVYDRVQVIEYEDVKAFWRFRGPNVEPLPDLTAEDVSAGRRPDLSRAAECGSVLYVLDELHEHLNSRQWKKTGEAVLYYIAKHRHLGDAVLWLTQSVPNVDKQWRSVTQEYIYCRNFKKEQWKGFSRGNGFRAESYLEPFTGTQQMQWAKEYKLSKEIARCYQTSTVGAKADTGEEKRGRSMWWVWGALIVLFLLVSGLSMFGPRLWAAYWGVVPTGTASGEAVAVQPEASAASSPVSSSPQVPGAVTGASGASSPASYEPQTVLAVPLYNVTPGEIIEESRTYLPAVKLLDAPSGAGVVIVGPERAVMDAAAVVRELDKLQPLVVVRAVIVRDSGGRSASYGFARIWDAARAADSEWGEALGAVTLNLGSLTQTAGEVATNLVTLGSVQAARLFLDVAGSQRITDEYVSVLSSPQVTVESGVQAVLAAGREIPVPVSVAQASGTVSSVEYKQADLSLSVLPVVQGNAISVAIEQSNAEVLENVSVSSSSVPVLSTQSIKTSVTVKPGEILILGGVKQETASGNRQGIPFLRDIPLIGFLVGGRENEFKRDSVWVFLTFEILGQ